MIQGVLVIVGVQGEHVVYVTTEEENLLARATNDLNFKVGHIGKLIDIRVNTTDLPLLIKTSEDMGRRVVAEWTADLQSLADMIEKVVPSVSKEALTTLLDIYSPILQTVSDVALFTRAHNGHRISFCKRTVLC